MKAMIDKADKVLIVGAGPTGLALAAFLAAHGVRARLIDRDTDRAHESRALAIQPRTLEVLTGIGVSAELVRLGNPNVAVRLHAGHQALSVPLFDLGLADTAYPYLLFLSQAETERVLVEHLTGQGVTVERGVELVSLQQNSDGVSAVLRHGDGTTEQVQAGYVAGCDGAHSTVRQLARIRFEGSSYPQTFVLADVEADGIEPGAAHVFLSGQGMLFFFPLVTPASWRLLVMRPKSDPDPPGAPVSLDEIQAIADTYTDGGVRLRDPVWMTDFRLHHRAATHYRQGRVLLAGDAAHIHSPAGAQGMNTGIQDSANLAWKLAHVLAGIAPASILDTYDAERSPIGRRVLRMSDRAFTIASSTNPVIRFARTRVAPALIPVALKAGSGRAYVWRTVSQLNIRYRNSPLSVDGPGSPRRGVRAGDRLPDTPSACGQVPTLHQLTRAPGWHLLICGTGWPDTLEHVLRGKASQLAGHRLDGSGHGAALAALRLHPDQPSLVLVRPDGHVGYRSTGSDTGGLLSYLDRWLKPSA